MDFKVTQPREAPETRDAEDHYFCMGLLCIGFSETVAIGVLENPHFPEITASYCRVFQREICCVGAATF